MPGGYAAAGRGEDGEVGMAARRAVAWCAAVLLPVAGIVGLAAGPAAADGDEVRLRAPGSFTAGGSPGSVTVTIKRKSRGCVLAQATLVLAKPGLTAEQVRVEVARNGRWQSTGARQAGDGTVAAGPIGTEREPLCKGDASIRFRVALAGGVTNGQVRLTGAAAGSGAVLGQDSRTARVRGGAAAEATSPPAPTLSPTPEVEEPAPAPAETPPAVTAPAAGPSNGSSSGGFGLVGALVMVLGGVLVALGVAILLFLLRRSRREGGDNSDNKAAGTVYGTPATYGAAADYGPTPGYNTKHGHGATPGYDTTPGYNTTQVYGGTQGGGNSGYNAAPGRHDATQVYGGGGRDAGETTSLPGYPGAEGNPPPPPAGTDHTRPFPIHRD
ncbi:hypothetical protein [Rhizomonospora bruguierae]|uniref:hypothetical protein n=1 Tax=Rhizomonospora bruguierae TaxID=1581705 RepID=UPI001BCD7434|nr:hypothetical protein [Micromonospora sp. NBRC 107566]